MRKIILGLIMAMSGVILFSQNTFADWVQQNSTYVDSRSYIVKTNPDQTNNVITDNSFGNRNIPFNALTYISGEYRYLHEIVTYNSIIDNSTDKFKSLMVDITFKSKRVQNPQSFGMTVITNRGNQYGGCVVNETGSDYIQFRCLANLQDNSTVTGVYVRIGEKTLPSTPICILNDYYDSNCQLSYMSINLTTTQDPAVSLLQQQLERQQQLINQNQTIINQNQQIINAQNETNDWLQDTTPPNVDTSSLNTSVGWMPAGPVDSILTLPLQLLQGIINVFTNTNCSPLVVPVPYVNEDITLPCVSTLMDDIGFTPVWNIVGGVISAVIIWDTLKWLYRFVDDTLTFRENNSGIWGGL